MVLIVDWISACSCWEPQTWVCAEKHALKQAFCFGLRTTFRMIFVWSLVVRGWMRVSHDIALAHEKNKHQPTKYYDI